jgi:pyruvate ferredoxin oxidoreductase delta subunit
MRLRVGGVCAAGGSKVEHTGNWRTFRPVVDNNECSKCGICETFCPDSCVEINDLGCNINYTYCKGCGICEHQCPFKAIKMEVER